MSVAESSASEEEVKVKAGSQGSQGVRHQLQAMVSGKLKDRGISTKELWTSSGTHELSKEEQDRLERQRYNKRKWAQKERARSKALLEELKQSNGMLEYTNQKLKREVDMLRERQLCLKDTLIEHQCLFGDSTSHIHLATEEESTHFTKGKDEASTKSSFHPHAGQPQPSSGSEGKGEMTGQGPSHNLLPATLSDFVSPDRYHANRSDRSSQQTQKLRIFHVNPCFYSATSLTARPGTSTETQQISSPPESRDDIEGTSEMDIRKSQSSDTRGVEIANPLSLGRFTESVMGDTGTLYLQRVQDDDDEVEMAQDVTGTLGKKKKRDENIAHYNKESRLRPQMRNEKDEEGGKSTCWKVGFVTPPPRITLKSEPDLEQRPQASNSTRTSPMSTTALEYIHNPLNHQPASFGRGHRMNQLAAAKKPKQTPGNAHELDFLQTSDMTVPKSAKHLTKKGVLMERWFAQNSNRLTKTRVKSAIPLSAKKKTSRPTIVNPWAVATSPETERRSVVSLPCSAISALDFTQATSISRKDSTIDTNDGNVKSRFIGRRLSTISTYIFDPSLDTDVSVFPEQRAGSSATVSAASLPDTDEDQAVTDSRFFSTSDSDAYPEQCQPKAEVDDQSIPTLTNEGHHLMRRYSWPSNEAEPAKSPVKHSRLLSLPSSFSDVIFEAADGSMQALLSSEQLLDTVLNPDNFSIAFPPMFATSTDLSGKKTDSFSAASSTNKTERQPSIFPSNFSLADTPSTPFAPSPPPLNFFMTLVQVQKAGARRGTACWAREL
ncbi:uncharacterized protein LOC143292776 [Babylonia areolata]|uniref:uncharacterized protein LOC143292776 n=1 Tax=Babylonia areolata TaxID=304850 RepID=UPI003FCFBB3F